MNSSLQKTPLWRDSTRVVVLIEEAVRTFPKYHKYALGADLRRQAITVCRLILRAYSARDNRLYHIELLVVAVDDLKLLVQLAKEVKAFKSFSQFQLIAELSVSVGRQSGAWLKRSHSEVSSFNR
jgi:hypothetical protein